MTLSLSLSLSGQAFLVLDKEKKGWLPKDQLSEWLSSVGEPMSKEDTQAILDEADSNHDGTIDCEGRMLWTQQWAGWGGVEEGEWRERRGEKRHGNRMVSG